MDYDEADKSALSQYLQDTISHTSELFDKLCQERYDKGAEEYGPFTFLENDVVRMLCEELVDTANYARMQFIKLIMLQNQLSEEIQHRPDIVDQHGFGTFKGAKDGWER